MKFRVPYFVYSTYERINEWGTTPLFPVGKWRVRRIDPLIALAAIGCASYYGWIGGWGGALTGLAAFTFVAMICLWF